MKEATLFLVDVGSTMGLRLQGRDVTDLEWAMQLVQARVGPKVLQERKTDVVGVVAVNSDATDHALGGLEGAHYYDHIAVLLPIQQILMPQIELLRQIRPSRCTTADLVSAIVVGIDLLMQHCRKNKWLKNLALITNARCARVSDEGVEGIVRQLQEQEIALTVLGIDFDSPHEGFKEEEKDPDKAYNERLLLDLCSAIDGAVFASFSAGLAEALEPHVRVVHPVSTFRTGTLTLGHVEQYPDEAIVLHIDRFSRTKAAKAISASRVSNLHAAAAGPSARNGAAGIGEVASVRTYTVADDKEMVGTKIIEREDLEKGYMYGRTIVNVSKDDEPIYTYETKTGMEILGFMAQAYLERYLVMSETSVILPRKHDHRAAVAFDSLVRAMDEEQAMALARFVQRDNKEPVMVLLVPEIGEVSCLLELQMPMAEDVRNYRFPALDVVRTNKGVMHEHRLIPTREMEAAVSEYVDAMDLSHDTEYMSPESRFSPVIHRVAGVVQHVAFNPTGGIPPIPDMLLQYSHPPKKLVVQAQPALDRVRQVCDIKKIPPRQLKRKYEEHEERQPMQPDLDALLHATKKQEPVIHISAESMLEDLPKAFKEAPLSTFPLVHEAAGRAVQQARQRGADTSAAMRLWRELAEEYEDEEQFRRYSEQLVG